jgi:hypothetical protein
MNKIVKMKDIEAEYTRIVKLYADNYKINVSTMSGTQGEMAKIDFTGADGIVYRVTIDNDRTSYDRYCETDTVVIAIYRFNNRRRSSTLWYKDGQIIYERKFFRIDRYGRDDVWTEDYNYAVNEINKGWSRVENKEPTYRTITNHNTINVIVKMIKKTKGYKSITAKNIERVYTEPGKFYRVYFKDRTKEPWTYYVGR